MRHAERFSLTGQVALVLGGSSGIGRQIALGLHDAGAVGHRPRGPHGRQSGLKEVNAQPLVAMEGATAERTLRRRDQPMRN